MKYARSVEVGASSGTSCAAFGEAWESGRCSIDRPSISKAADIVLNSTVDPAAKPVNDRHSRLAVTPPIRIAAAGRSAALVGVHGVGSGDVEVVRLRAARGASVEALAGAVLGEGLLKSAMLSTPLKETEEYQGCQAYIAAGPFDEGRFRILRHGVQCHEGGDDEAVELEMHVGRS